MLKMEAACICPGKDAGRKNQSRSQIYDFSDNLSSTECGNLVGSRIFSRALVVGPLHLKSAKHMSNSARFEENVNTSEKLTFATYAHQLRDAGLAVIPLAAGDCAELGDRAGKKPLTTGFEKWKGRPSHKTIDGWCKKFPDANVGYVPGLSGLVAIDDDGGAGELIRETFGDTHGRIKSRRGAHYLYQKPRGQMPGVVDLRAFGINADLKHGNSIAIAPPSSHRSGHVYEWLDCGPDVLQDLPPFRVDLLQKLLDSRKVKTQDQKKADAGFRSGSRKMALNDHLVKNASWADSFDEVLDVAMTWNDDHLTKYGIEKLEEGEVMQIAAAVWKDLKAGKLERWHGRRATVRSNLSEIDQLAAISKDGMAAYMLLMKLRGEHGGRMARNETFALNQVAMAKAGTIPNWTRYDYEKARAVLLKAGMLEIVETPSNSRAGRQPTRYKLASGRGAGAV